MNPHIALSSFHECFDYFSEFSGLNLIKRETMRGAISGLGHPLFNYVYDFRLDDFSGLKQDFEYFRTLGTPYTIALLESDLPKLQPMIEEFDFRFNAFAQGMMLSLEEDTPADVNPEIDVRMVENDAGLKDWDVVSAENFRHPIGFAFKYAKALVDAKMDQVRFYVAYKNKEPVGQAMLFLGQENAGCFWSSVKRSARGTGVHKKLMEVRLNDAKQLGRKNVIVQAFKTSYQNLVQQRGFKEVERLATFYTMHGH